MGSSAALLQEIAVMERIQAEIAAVTGRSDQERKHELVKLRRLLSEQIGRVSVAGEAIFGDAVAPHLTAEYRARLSAMRSAIALHQANWPAVSLDSADAGFTRSVLAARSAKDAFISWTRGALKDLT